MATEKSIPEKVKVYDLNRGVFKTGKNQPKKLTDVQAEETPGDSWAGAVPVLVGELLKTWSRRDGVEYTEDDITVEPLGEIVNPAKIAADDAARERKEWETRLGSAKEEENTTSDEFLTNDKKEDDKGSSTAKK